MKVLIITPYLASVYGGPARVVKELSKQLSSFGVNVDVITTNANGCSKLETPVNQWIAENHYRVRYFDCFNKRDFIISLSLLKWLSNHINDYDIVHTNTIFSPLISVAHCICKFYKVPYIMATHGMLEPWAFSHKAWKKLPYYFLVEKPILQNASAIHVNSSIEASNIKLFNLKSQVFLIPNGIHNYEFVSLPEPEVFYQKFPETQHKKIILFLARLAPQKGLDLLAPAFAAVRERFSYSHLVIAGPDNIDFLPKVRSYFEQSGCLDAVTFTGMLTGSMKYAAMSAASLYVAPSYSEGFSVSVLEGMASGLPCVLTTACNFPEAAAAQVAHVVNINAEAIAEGIIQCLSHPQQAREMGDRAREFIFQNYTWEQLAQKMSQVYKAIIEKKPLSELVSNTAISFTS